VPDVVLPVLDEARALPGVLGAMPAGYRPIVVDNGSSDGSGRIAAELGARVVAEPRRGFGAACYAGLLAADQEIVCFMDCDGSLDPGELPRLVVALGEGTGLAVGARIPEPGAWPLHARLANRALAFELRRRTGLTLHDIGPMRAARRAALVDLGLLDRRSGWPLEMVLRADAAGWGIAEVPVSYRRRSGRSKVTGTVRGTAQAIGDMSALLRGLDGA
jgi:glycosyltransferase involved in cell wall biosynthesis